MSKTTIQVRRCLLKDILTGCSAAVVAGQAADGAYPPAQWGLASLVISRLTAAPVDLLVPLLWNCFGKQSKPSLPTSLFAWRLPVVREMLHSCVMSIEKLPPHQLMPHSNAFLEFAMLIRPVLLHQINTVTTTPTSKPLKHRVVAL